MDKLPDLISSKITVNKETGCWEWCGRKNQNGYGLMWWTAEKRERAVHRVIYEILVGPIPEGLAIDHLCFVRNCCNPAHLEPVTTTENLRRQGARITHCARGHQYTAENTYRKRAGHRDCRACIRARVRAYKARLAAA